VEDETMRDSRCFEEKQGGIRVNLKSDVEATRPCSDAELFEAMHRTFAHTALIFRYESVAVGKSEAFLAYAEAWQFEDWPRLYKTLRQDEAHVLRMTAAERDIVLNWYGQAARQLGQYDEAELIYRHAIQICSSHQVLGWLLANLAGALMRLGRCKQALQVSLDALTRTPAAPEALCNALCAASLLKDAALCDKLAGELIRNYPKESREKDSVIGRTLRFDLDLLFWRRQKRYAQLFPSLCVSLPNLLESGDFSCEY